MRKLLSSQHGLHFHVTSVKLRIKTDCQQIVLKEEDSELSEQQCDDTQTTEKEKIEPTSSNITCS